MDEEHKHDSPPPDPPQASEYGDALGDVLKDQERRDELRSTATPKAKRARVHPSIPPVLALFSVWLWVFPPAALIPEVPSIPQATLEAGLRMEMWIQLNNIQRFITDNGRLPGDLDEVGERPDGVQYTRLSDGVFQLSGKAGQISVDYTSTEPVDALVADAMAIVTGTSNPAGAS